MQEYVISQGILEPLGDHGGGLEVVYGFMTLPYREEESGEVRSQICAISVRSLQGIFLSPGRYRLTTKEKLTFLLERNNVGWQVVKEGRLSTPLVIEHDPGLSAAVRK